MAPAAACGTLIRTPTWAAWRRRSDQRVGGDGWFGTVGLGYDWQFNGSWVAGIFADGQFGSMRGNLNDEVTPLTGRIKNEDNWAAGVRLGYLVAPNVYSYVNGGYSGSHWSGTTLTNLIGAPSGLHTNSFNRNGWFVGGGVENNLNIFGISAPGWFMKTEYRAAYYDTKNIAERLDIGKRPDTVARSPSTPWSRPSAPRWSTASTGLALWSRSTDLTSI